MHNNLAIEIMSPEKAVNARETVTAMCSILENKFGINWNPLVKKRATFGLDNKKMDVGINQILESTWKERKKWVKKQQETVLSNLRTPVMGEEESEMVYSDNEGEKENIKEENEDENELY